MPGSATRTTPECPFFLVILSSLPQSQTHQTAKVSSPQTRALLVPSCRSFSLRIRCREVLSSPPSAWADHLTPGQGSGPPLIVSPPGLTVQGSGRKHRDKAEAIAERLGQLGAELGRLLVGGGCKAGLGMSLCRELLFTEIDHSV